VHPVVQQEEAVAVVADEAVGHSVVALVHGRAGEDLRVLHLVVAENEACQ
jgi:hypothetical protein